MSGLRQLQRDHVETTRTVIGQHGLLVFSPASFQDCWQWRQREASLKKGSVICWLSATRIQQRCRAWSDTLQPDHIRPALRLCYQSENPTLNYKSKPTAWVSTERLSLTLSIKNKSILTVHSLGIALTQPGISSSLKTSVRSGLRRNHGKQLALPYFTETEDKPSRGYEGGVWVPGVFSLYRAVCSKYMAHCKQGNTWNWAEVPAQDCTQGATTTWSQFCQKQWHCSWSPPQWPRQSLRETFPHWKGSGHLTQHNGSGKDGCPWRVINWKLIH